MTYRLVALASLTMLGCTARALDLPQDLGPDSSVVDLLGLDIATQKHATCPAGTNFIFTLDESGTLSRFNPHTAEFFDAGPLDCPTQLGGELDSMAIDRDGNGWVFFTSGELFRLIPDTLSCTATPFHSLPNPVSLGMAFSEDSPGSASETLYISPGETPAELESVNLTTFQLVDLASINGPDGCELTGDDEGNLWGYFPSTGMPFIARIDKQTGALDRRIDLAALQGSPGGYGMAGYQGDFYVFFETVNDPSTNVYRVDGTTGQLTTLLSNTGRTIIGVGAATCAGDGLDGLD